MFLNVFFFSFLLAPSVFCPSQDEAARRRLVKKLYIPLPDAASRMQLLRITMSRDGVDHRLSEQDFSAIVARAEGYSGSDMAALATEASMGPIRSMSLAMNSEDDISDIQAECVRPIEMEDFDAAFKSIRPSVNQKDLNQYLLWNNQFGSFPSEQQQQEIMSRQSPPAAAATTTTAATTIVTNNAEMKENA